MPTDLFVFCGGLPWVLLYFRSFGSGLGEITGIFRRHCKENHRNSSDSSAFK
jgi:hypothetical protein